MYLIVSEEVSIIEQVHSYLIKISRNIYSIRECFTSYLFSELDSQVYLFLTLAGAWFLSLESKALYLANAESNILFVSSVQIHKVLIQGFYDLLQHSVLQLVRCQYSRDYVSIRR